MDVEGRDLWVNRTHLRQAAFAIDQMTPGGIDRAQAGAVTRTDLDAARRRLKELIKRPATSAKRRQQLETLMKNAGELDRQLVESGADRAIYLERAEQDLQPRLRSAAIEIDFCFGDKDGRISLSDIKEARRRYGGVRGPVGWNRLLLTDELERRLFPRRTLSSVKGMKLVPADWLVDGPDRVLRLRKVAKHLEEGPLARTYADIAARLAVAAPDDPERPVYEDALEILGSQIVSRDSARPTITDIARIGCEDPEVKAVLSTPIEMSRKLSPSLLLDRFLS